MAEDTELKTRPAPPANVIVPKKKVDEWDAVLAETKGSINKMSRTISGVASQVDALGGEIDDLGGKIEGVKNTVITFGVLTLLVQLGILALLYFG